MSKKEKRLAAIQRQQALVKAAKDGSREMTAEEKAEFESLQREIDNLTAEINAEENQQRGIPQEQNPAPEPAPGSTSETTHANTNEQRVLEERTRITNITAMCREFDMEDAELQRFIKDGISEDNVRAAILDNLRKRSAPITAGIHVTNTGEDDFRRDAADGLLIRGGVEIENPSNGANQFSHMTLRDLAVECMERAGATNARRMSSDELLRELFTRQYYNPTAAFPTILDNAINKAYVQGHRTAAVTFDQWTRKGSLKDFKIHDNNYLAGPVGDFLEVPEGGELKNDIPTDAKLPTRQIKTYGKQFTLSRQAFINDDIDLVTRIPARYAAAARRTINTQCYRILMNNPAIYDGKALFHADHKNILTTGTGITQAAVQSMILALSTQKDEFGQPIIVRPGKIIVPAGLDFTIYTIFNSPTINTADNTQAVNPLYQYRDLQIISDPTINTLAGGFGNVMPWFMTANTSDSSFIEVDYLNGQEVPTIRRMETPGQLGFVWDIYLDWGINVMDFRGAIKNPGVVITNPLG